MDRFEELIDNFRNAVAYAERRKCLGEFTVNELHEANKAETAARAALLEAIRAIERPTHAYCIVTNPDYDPGEIKHIWLDEAETEAAIAKMNDPRAWISEEGPYEIWPVKLELPEVEMMTDEDMEGATFE